MSGATLGLAIASLAVGPLLAWGLERRAPLRATLDGFVLVMTAGLALLFLLPHAYRDAGWWALPLALIGFALPGIAETSFRQTRSETSGIVLVFAVAALLLHCAIDGAALAVGADPSTASAGGRSDVTLAIVSHRLPVGLFVWSVVSPVGGRRLAAAGLLGLMVATALGYSIGPELLAAGGGHLSMAGGIEALLAGGLLHVVVGHPGSAEGAKRPTWAGAGALAAVAVFSVLPPSPSEALALSWDAGWSLLIEASPAILAGFLGAGLLSLVPQRVLSRWMRGKTALGSAARGVVFGLPIPICSCGVVPLYRGLMQRGLPPAAAAAFLVATPELGVDAVAISLPLLGWELTLVRIAAATLLALCVGLAVAALTSSRDLPAADLRAPTEDAERQGLWGALRYGFVDSLDELGPWILAGIALAALLEPLLDPSWIAAIPSVAEIPFFASLAAPVYVCASAATPVGAAFLAKGVSAGAVLAFLLAGPATNVTTFGAVKAFHGMRTTLLLVGILVGTTLLLGAFVNLLAGPELTSPIATREEPPGLLATLPAFLFVGLLVASVLRQGPRGFLGRLGARQTQHERDHASCDT